MTKLELKGTWNEVTGKLKQKYALLTDNDLAYIEGKADEMLGQIQRRTGTSREELEQYLRDECNCCC